MNRKLLQLGASLCAASLLVSGPLASASVTTYRYDAVGQLVTSSQNGSRHTSYAFDQAGNRQLVRSSLLTLGSDFIGPGRTDLLLRNIYTGAIQDWDRGVSSSSTSLGGVGVEWSIVVGDLDGDGVTDIVFRNTNTGGNVVWDGGQASTAHALTAVDPVWKLLFAGDFDGDGKADLFFRNDDTGALVIWKGGDSSNSAYLGGVGPEWQIVAGDLDGEDRKSVV